MVTEEDSTYLGLDFSTQQLKGVIVNHKLEILHETHVQFDSSLPEYRTHCGVIHGSDPKNITAPTVMWVKALDLLLDQLGADGADFSKLAAVSGSGQQHGTVYWQNNARKTLKSLDPSNFLYTQLASSFSVPYGPVWMDSNTSKQCSDMEKAVGGPERLAEITGSKAYERFSGPQIRKIYESKPSAYDGTERISLVSSFGCSLFLGDYAPIDFSDGSGMNLMDVQSKKWSQECLDACAPNLSSKLGELTASSSLVGTVSEYFVERFGFNPDTKIVSFTGDNPASLAGMCLKKNDVAISLGTSDTLFLWLDKPVTLPDGHVLVNPVDENAYMILLCFKNGSLTRVRLRDHLAKGSWSNFNNLLSCTPRGNFGYIGLYFDSQEIIPWALGEHRYDEDDKPIPKFQSPEIEIRALVEGQFIAKRAHAEDIGFAIGEHSRIIATGGGSNNPAMLQVLSDVFNSPVYAQDCSNSSMLGAAYQAKFGLMKSQNKELTFSDVTSTAPAPKLVCTPSHDARQIYDPMVERYRKIVAKFKKH
nr:PREDICTED: xylulose kinase [Bemisia tabaci]